MTKTIYKVCAVCCKKMPETRKESICDDCTPKSK